MIKICIPGVLNWEFVHLLLLSVLLLSRTLLTISVAKAMGNNVQSLVEANFYEFINGVTYVGLLSIPASIINSLLKYVSNMFALYCRRRLTKHGHEMYLSGNAMYRPDISSLPW